MRHLLALVLLTAACGSKDTAKTDKAGSATGGSSAGAGSAKQQVKEADLFTGSAVTLPTPAAKLKLGMTEADAKAVAPELVVGPGGYDVPGTEVNYRSTKIVVETNFGAATDLRMDMLASKDEVKGWLTSKWGTPIEHADEDGKSASYWLSPENGLRAKLLEDGKNSILRFEVLLPRAKILGSDPKHFGFDLPPLIGMSKAEAIKALAPFSLYPPQTLKDDPSDLAIQFPKSEDNFANYGSTLNLKLKDDKVTGYSFGYSAGDAKDVDALRAKLEGMYGKGKVDPNLGYIKYPSNVTAELKTDLRSTSSVWVGDHR